jgi:ATP-dependent Lon protease
VLRKVTRQIVEPELAPMSTPVTITVDFVRSALGRPRFFNEARERIDQPGVATGLVWTPAGGDIVFVEASVVEGNRELRLTGQLGDVMRESAEAALTCVRARAHSLGIDPRFFDTHAVHIHVPGGAVPKDGPSAGITMATALASAATGRLVRDDVAMTGEITLRGRVLPVGGVKEKVLGAHRAGIGAIILPRRNDVDLDDLPRDVREGVDIRAGRYARRGARSSAAPASGGNDQQPVRVCHPRGTATGRHSLYRCGCSATDVALPSHWIADSR